MALVWNQFRPINHSKDHTYNKIEILYIILTLSSCTLHREWQTEKGTKLHFLLLAIAFLEYHMDIWVDIFSCCCYRLQNTILAACRWMCWGQAAYFMQCLMHDKANDELKEESGGELVNELKKIVCSHGRRENNRILLLPVLTAAADHQPLVSLTSIQSSVCLLPPTPSLNPICTILSIPFVRLYIKCCTYEMNEWTTHYVTWCDFWVVDFLYSCARKLEFGYYIIIRFKGNSTLCAEHEWMGGWFGMVINNTTLLSIFVPRWQCSRREATTIEQQHIYYYT